MLEKIKYGEIPSFDDFVSHLRSYVDDEGELVVGDPPEVFWMEIPIDSDDYSAFANSYELLSIDMQNQIDVNEDGANDTGYVCIVFSTYESFYEFLSTAAGQWNDSNVMELASSIMYTLGYNWS